MMRPSSLFLTCLIASSALYTVVQGNEESSQHLRRAKKSKKMYEPKMKKYKYGGGFMKGGYNKGYVGNGAMKQRPHAMSPTTDIFAMKSKSMMGTDLWMYKGKGKGKGQDWKGKGKSKKMGSSKRYYPPHPPFYPNCSGDQCSSECISVTDMFLVDSTNNVRLFPIQQSEFLDFDFLESFYGVTEFSVECVADGNVGSMFMADNFGTSRIDNDAPFILAGDNMGDFFDSNFRRNPGTWRVTCQPFCEDNAMGEAGPPETISFVVGPGDGAPTPSPVAGPGPGPECDVCRAGCIDVVDFVLVDANTNTQIRSIVQGETIMVGPDDQFTVECITDPAPFAADPFPIGSAVLTDNVENIEPNLENSPPFALADDDSGNYNPSSFYENPGPWEVGCTAFCGVGATGDSSPTRTISFTIEAETQATPRPPVPATPTPPATVPTFAPTLDCSTCREGCIFANFFYLVNADTNERIRPMVEGETLQVSQSDSFALECVTTPEPFSATPFPIGSTFLTDNYEESGNSENSPPYSLADDDSGNFFPSPLYDYPGEWIVTCQAFCEPNQGGDESNLLTLTFDVQRV